MNDEQIEKIKALGKVWEKGSIKRVYFSAASVGLDVHRYGTGNVSGGRWDDGKGCSSNAEVRRLESLLKGNFWFDLVLTKFVKRDGAKYEFDILVNKILEKVA